MRNFKKGDIVKHFKHELHPDKYLYEIIGIAIHSETREKLMVYKALYDDYGLFVRPLEMFNSKVDKIKYPNIKQEYRFELKEDYEI